MYVQTRDAARPIADPTLEAALEADVYALAQPRHARAQPIENRRVREYIAEALSDAGLRVQLQGESGNVVALPPSAAGPLTLVCAHYDSVPSTPGADDNASGLAAMLAAARARARPNVGFVAVNGEEDGLVGSTELAGDLERVFPTGLAGVHVMEMVGFASDEPGSQRSPVPLPWMPDVGDFIGLVADGRSSALRRRVMRAARDTGPRVVALQTHLGLHRCLPDLERSDHSPFWARGVPALMWTDTAEFRNPNYHQPSDTPETLDYAFMADVCRLLDRALG